MGKMLYKYYSNKSEYAFKNVENGNICFTNIRSLNDLAEGSGYYSISPEQEKCMKLSGMDLASIIRRESLEEVQLKINFLCRVFCAAKKYDNHLLWANYANSHQGFCIGYEEKDVLKIANKVVDVKYRKKLSQFDEFNMDAIRQILSSKLYNWHEEKERRALYFLEHKDISSWQGNGKMDEDKIYVYTDDGIEDGKNPRQNVERYCANKIICKACKPSKIYLGARMDIEDRKRLVKVAQKWDIAVYKMVYRASLTKLDAIELSDSEKQRLCR